LITQLETTKSRTNIDSLDLGDLIPKSAESAHASDLTVHKNEIESAQRCRISTDFVDDGWHILARRHAYDFISRDTEGFLDLLKNP